MPPSSGMSGYPTPSSTYSQPPAAYHTQASPASPYGQTAYYNNSSAFSIDPVMSEQQVAKARRQQQNRDAQKRFREKKKQTQAEMEIRLDELEKQLEEAEADNERLANENDQLKKMLLAQRGQSMAPGGGRAAGRPPQQSGFGPGSRRPTLSPP